MKEHKKVYSTPIVAGILIMAFFLAYQFFSPVTGDAKRLLQGTLSIILRIFACFWVASLTTEQGRKSILFVILGIFLPAITLIIVGLLGDKKSKTIASGN